MKPTLCVVILTRQANSAIGRHLNTLGIADEVIIISDQKPKTSVLPKKVKIYHHPLTNNFASQRNYALKLATSDWVLFLDDDEKPSNNLIREISRSLGNEFDGFRLKRIDSYYNQILIYGETGRTKLLRLGKRTEGRWHRPVHETWKIKGKIKDLEFPLYHLREDLTSGFISRMSHYSLLDAPVLHKEGKPFSVSKLLFLPLAKFLRNYLFYLGFLDGTLGLFHAYLMSVQSLTVRVVQWEKSL